MKMSDAMQAVVFLRDLGNRRLIKEVAKGIWMRSPGGQFEGQKHGKTNSVTNIPYKVITECSWVAKLC